MAVDLSLLEAALLDRDVVQARVVGFSGGGYRGLALGLSGRIRVRSLVSLAGYATLPNEVRARLRTFAYAVREQTLPDSVVVDQMLSPSFASSHPQVVVEVRSWLGSQDGKGLAQQLEAVADCADLSAQLGEIEAPVVARVGAMDIAVPKELSQQIADGAHDGKFELVEGVGHALLCEDFDGSLASIRRALARAE